MTINKITRQMLNQVGFAIVGCGHIAHKHCSAIVNHLDSGDLIAVCDLVEQKAKEFGNKYNVPWFTKIEDMMSQVGDKINVINILTPSGYHCENVLALAPYGKHLCVEKPIALTVSDADKMINICKKFNVYLFVVMQNRFNVPIQILHSAIVEGRLGKFVLGSVRLFWCRPQSYYDKDDWRGTFELDGGVFANQASHFIDLLYWLMGDIKSVWTKGKTRLANIETEDTGVAIFEFSSGALGVIEATTAARPSNLEGSLTILGELGTVEIGGSTVNELKTWKFVNPRLGDENIIETAKNPPGFLDFGHACYLKSVVETLVEGKPPSVDGEAGRNSIALIEAIYKSMATGKEVYL
jgi:UDP-N-acetyl-2-amino-2-deoxyglucuronate dehydrogenase